MVKVFMAHSSNDEKVDELVDYIEQKKDKNGNAIDEYNKRHADALVLGNGGFFWKIEAKKLIKQSNVVIFVQGEKSAQSPYIQWEIETAIKLNKIVMLYNPDNYPAAPWMTMKDPFSQKEKPIAYACNKEKIKARIDNFDMNKYNIFSYDIDERLNGDKRDEVKKEILEQYKMYQKTSEDLVSRRQSVNSFYNSLNTALVALQGAVMGIVEMPNKIFILIAMAMAGIVLCLSWRKLLDAYGTLNSSKMKVINLIEKQLPLKLYDTEWEIMSDRLNSKKYVSFTKSTIYEPR